MVSVSVLARSEVCVKIKKTLVYGMVGVVARWGGINAAIPVTDKPQVQRL